MNRLFTLSLFCIFALTASAQQGPVGFVNCRDGIWGIRGGMDGAVVRVNNRQDLATYAGAATPYTIIVEGKLEGNGLKRQKDIIEVASNKTIVGVKGAELAGTITATTFNPGTLLYGQTYYWRVDVVNSIGTVIPGDVWTFSAPARPVQTGRTEVEHLARSAYAYLEREDGAWFKASNDSVTVGEAGPGAMTGVWTDDDGLYQVSIDFYDEKAGQAWMGFSVNDVLVDSWRGNKQYAMTTHTITFIAFFI